MYAIKIDGKLLEYDDENLWETGAAFFAFFEHYDLAQAYLDKNLQWTRDWFALGQGSIGYLRRWESAVVVEVEIKDVINE